MNMLTVDFRWIRDFEAAINERKLFNRLSSKGFKACEEDVLQTPLSGLL